LPLSSPDILDNRATAGWRGESRREGAKPTPRFFPRLYRGQNDREGVGEKGPSYGRIKGWGRDNGLIRPSVEGLTMTRKGGGGIRGFTLKG